jgi:plasmid stabilization system protein ParE
VNLHILAEAEAEIESARRYLSERSSRLAELFIEDLEQTFDAVAERPASFSKLETLPDNSPYRRALLSVFRYAVVFEILTDEIVVVAVTHTSREPNYWLDRGP